MKRFFADAPQAVIVGTSHITEACTGNGQTTETAGPQAPLQKERASTD